MIFIIDKNRASFLLLHSYEKKNSSKCSKYFTFFAWDLDITVNFKPFPWVLVKHLLSVWLSFLNFCGSKYHGIFAQKTVGYPYSRDSPDSRIGVPMFCHCQSKGIVNISITWSSRATMQQSTQSEDDCSLVFLHNLHRTKVIKLLYHCRAWQDYENDMILKWSSLLGFRLLKLN